MSKVTQVDFLPKEMVSYSKETQTPTEAMTHTDQKAGKETLSQTFTPAKSKVSGGRKKKNVNLCFADEEEDEEITAPPPAEDNQEDKDEQGEQQQEGKERHL